MLIVIDYRGTLEENERFTVEQCANILFEAKCRGHWIVIWTGSLSAVRPVFVGLANELAEKPGVPAAVRGDWRHTLVVDDDLLLLRAAKRWGARVLPASRLDELVAVASEEAA